MKIRTHFKHNVFMLNEAGELLEHLGGTEDYLLAAELYEVALRRWPEARIQMREGARIVYDNKRSVVVYQTDKMGRPCAASARCSA
jgi:hypothetical protein